MTYSDNYMLINVNKFLRYVNRNPGLISKALLLVWLDDISSGSKKSDRTNIKILVYFPLCFK